MAGPKVILMDKPSMGLAPVIMEKVFATIQRLKESEISLLLVEQMANKALEVADYVYVIEHGRGSWSKGNLMSSGKKSESVRHIWVTWRIKITCY